MFYINSVFIIIGQKKSCYIITMMCKREGSLFWNWFQRFSCSFEQRLNFEVFKVKVSSLSSGWWDMLTGRNTLRIHMASDWVPNIRQIIKTIAIVSPNILENFDLRIEFWFKNRISAVWILTWNISHWTACSLLMHSISNLPFV